MNWYLNNSAQVWALTASHLAIAVPAILATLVISLPIGWLAARYRWSRATLLTLCALLYTIPSLPLLIFLPALLGTGLRDTVNVIVALTLYGIAIQVGVTATALAGIERGPIEAARAIGYASWRRFWEVDVLLALPEILAGLRVVAVSTVSLVTVSAVLGTPNLGQLFTNGIQRGLVAEIVTGIVFTVGIALILDAIIAATSWLFAPWNRARRIGVER